jgi:hypothetical protein
MDWETCLLKSRVGPVHAKLGAEHSTVEVRELRLLQSETFLCPLAWQHVFWRQRKILFEEVPPFVGNQCPTLLYMQERLLSDSLLKTMLEPRRRIHTLPIRNLHKHALSGTLKVGGFCFY